MDRHQPLSTLLRSLMRRERLEGAATLFGVGLLHCDEPYELLRPMQRIRDRRHFYDEIKWNKVSRKNLPALEEIVNALAGSSATFSAFVADKSKYDIIGRFGDGSRRTSAWRASSCEEAQREGKRCGIIADEYSTPPAKHL